MGYHKHLGRMYCLHLPDDAITSQQTLQWLRKVDGLIVLEDNMECSSSEGPTCIIGPLHCPNHFSVYLAIIPSPWRWGQHVPPKRRCQNPGNYHLVSNCRERLKTYTTLHTFHIHRSMPSFVFTHVHYEVLHASFNRASRSQENKNISKQWKSYGTIKSSSCNSPCVFAAEPKRYYVNMWPQYKQNIQENSQIECTNFTSIFIAHCNSVHRNSNWTWRRNFSS